MRGNDQFWNLTINVDMKMLKADQKKHFDKWWEAMIRFEHLWNWLINIDAKMLKANQKKHIGECWEAMINLEEDWSNDIKGYILITKDLI